MDNLIKRARQQDADAFTTLMQSQMQAMYKIARAMLKNDEDAADAISETIFTCWEKIGQLKRIEFFKTWMTRILEAVWEFDFELKGSDAVRTVTLSEPLGESGATVTYAEISPISLYVNYNFPLEKVEIEAVDETGKRITTTDFREAPALMGVRLKDGTLMTGIMNDGSEEYLDENKTVYTASYAVRSIIDTEQVDVLLFLKSAPDGGGKLTEENLYIVPIK